MKQGYQSEPSQHDWCLHVNDERGGEGGRRGGRGKGGGAEGRHTFKTTGDNDDQFEPHLCSARMVKDGHLTTRN